ncbi:MAG: hypothetical protein ABR578_04935, partial [Chromatocurvus sp.]
LYVFQVCGHMCLAQFRGASGVLAVNERGHGEASFFSRSGESPGRELGARQTGLPAQLLEHFNLFFGQVNNCSHAGIPHD